MFHHLPFDRQFEAEHSSSKTHYPRLYLMHVMVRRLLAQEINVWWVVVKGIYLVHKLIAASFGMEEVYLE